MNIINQWGERQKEGEGEGAIFKVPWGEGKGGEHDFWLKFSGGRGGPGRKLCWKIRLLIEASLKGRHNCNIKNSKVILWSSQNVLIQNQWDLCKKRFTYWDSWFELNLLFYGSSKHLWAQVSKSETLWRENVTFNLFLTYAFLLINYLDLQSPFWKK